MYDKEQRKSKNYLNQQFNTTRPNEVWVSDVTYFKFNNKSYHICAVLDLFSRRVVGYKVGKVNSTQLVKSTFLIAYADRQPVLPLTFHTDRGSNYRSKTFCVVYERMVLLNHFQEHIYHMIIRLWNHFSLT